MGAAAICISTMDFYVIDVFLIVVTIFPLNLMIIGSNGKEIETVEFWLLSIF